MFRWLGLALVSIATACQRPTAKDVVRKALIDAVGINMVDCGRSAVDDSGAIQRNCALDSHRDRKSFIVLFEIAGKEGELYEVGMGGDRSGIVYTLEVESGDNFRELYGKVKKEGGRLVPRACPTPTKLEVVGKSIRCLWK